MTDSLKEAFYKDLTEIVTLSPVSIAALAASLAAELFVVETIGEHIPVNLGTVLSFATTPFAMAAYANGIVKNRTAQFQENMTQAFLHAHDCVIGFFSNKKEQDANIPR